MKQQNSISYIVPLFQINSKIFQIKLMRLQQNNQSKKLIKTEKKVKEILKFLFEINILNRKKVLSTENNIHFMIMPII